MYDEGRQVETRMGVGDVRWVYMTIVVCEENREARKGTRRVTNGRG